MGRFVRVIVVGIVVAVAWSAPASAQVVQTPINPRQIPQFAQPLPLLNETGVPVLDTRSGSPAFISVCEFQSQVLPAGTLGKKTPAPMTWVWGYEVGQACVPAPAHSYIGPVVLAQRHVPTQLTFINQLPNADPYGIGLPNPAHVLAYTQSTDQTMHWADPLNSEQNWCSKQIATGNLPSGYCLDHYTGPIPAAVHLHGGEVPPDLDGGPDSWFTGQPDLGNENAYYRGHGYYTREVDVLPELPLEQAEYPAGVLVHFDGQYYVSDGNAWTATTTVDRATYVYPNQQEASDIWFHDHILGMTRLNVYAGIAGAYVITDDAETHEKLRNPGELIPVVIQDRMFDTTGQLFFDNVGINLEHPYWVPEFVGNVIVVNGKAWPYLNLKAQKYRFLFLNGSNARAYELYLNDIDNDQFGPPMWVIGTDGGFLDAPAMIDPNAVPPQKLVIMPGERYEVVIDFTNFPNRRLQLWNTAKTPFPFGAPVDGRTTKRIMEIRVGALSDATPTAFDPATMSPRVTPIKRLTDLAATPDVRRQLTLNEVMGPGGPLEVLLNNTKWDGRYVDANGVLQPRPEFLPVDLNGVPSYYSEVPLEGTTEVWEIINITADAHPIHLHLVQFQLLERQALDNVACYDPIYRASFPTGLLMEGYGPPANYLTGVNANGVQIAAVGVLGGNPDPALCLIGLPMLPLPSEAGWKDTVVTYPDQVTRIAVRWAPTDLATDTPPADLGYPFDPNHGHGYVWHCHILDHEDNEMMRPTQVNPNVQFQNRSFTKGTNY